eukprot:5703849-Amphidinium_carterae.1
MHLQRPDSLPGHCPANTLSLRPQASPKSTPFASSELITSISEIGALSAEMNSCSASAPSISATSTTFGSPINWTLLIKGLIEAVCQEVGGEPSQFNVVEYLNEEKYLLQPKIPKSEQPTIGCQQICHISNAVPPISDINEHVIQIVPAGTFTLPPNPDACIIKPIIIGQEAMTWLQRMHITSEGRHGLYVGRAFSVVKDFHDDGNGPCQNSAHQHNFPIGSMKTRHVNPASSSTAWVETVRHMDVIAACGLKPYMVQYYQTHPTFDPERDFEHMNEVGAGASSSMCAGGYQYRDLDDNVTRAPVPLTQTTVAADASAPFSGQSNRIAECDVHPTYGAPQYVQTNMRPGACPLPHLTRCRYQSLFQRPCPCSLNKTPVPLTKYGETCFLACRTEGFQRHEKADAEWRRYLDMWNPMPEEHRPQLPTILAARTIEIAFVAHPEEVKACIASNLVVQKNKTGFGIVKV